MVLWEAFARNDRATILGWPIWYCGKLRQAIDGWIAAECGCPLLAPSDHPDVASVTSSPAANRAVRGNDGAHRCKQQCITIAAAFTATVCSRARKIASLGIAERLTQTDYLVASTVFVERRNTNRSPGC
jgi:hypothetical protein